MGRDFVWYSNRLEAINVRLGSSINYRLVDPLFVSDVPQ